MTKVINILKNKQPKLKELCKQIASGQIDEELGIDDETIGFIIYLDVDSNTQYVNAEVSCYYILAMLSICKDKIMDFIRGRE